MANTKIVLSISDKHAYVPLNGDALLCIGTNESVDGKSPEQIVEMIASALAHAQYNAISSGKGLARN